MKRLAAIVAALFAAQAPIASAHHAFTSLYDCFAPVVLTGKVTAVEWVNPHTWVHLTADDGKVWDVEGGTPNTLLRLGLSRGTLKPGTAITLNAYLPKDRTCAEAETTHVLTCKAQGRSLTLAGGKPMFMGASGTGAPADGADISELGPVPYVTRLGPATIDTANIGSYLKPGDTTCRMEAAK